MSSGHHSSKSSRTLAGRLDQEAKVSSADCYQCGKCTAGCPAASEMDFRPSEVMRMLQLELPQHEKKLLTSKAIWMCVGCETCYSRCPKKVDLPRAMDFLREEALAQGLAHKEATDVQAFHRAFLNSIAGRGRVYEFGMIAEFKRRTGRVFQDVTLGAPMMMKGKISLLPHAAKDKKAVARIMARVKAKAEAKAKARKEARS